MHIRFVQLHPTLKRVVGNIINTCNIAKWHLKVSCSENLTIKSIWSTMQLHLLVDEYHHNKFYYNTSMFDMVMWLSYNPVPVSTVCMHK